MTISKPAGAPSGTTIYYTTDGSDPRQSGGAPNPTAPSTTTSAIVTVNASVRVKARIRDSSGNWSTLTDATFFLNSLPTVRITELNYHPADRAGVTDADDMEFIELTNTGTQSIDLERHEDRPWRHRTTSRHPPYLPPASELPSSAIEVSFNQSTARGVNFGGWKLLRQSSTTSARKSACWVRWAKSSKISHTATAARGPVALTVTAAALEIINPTGDPTDPHQLAFQLRIRRHARHGWRGSGQSRRGQRSLHSQRCPSG